MLLFDDNDQAQEFVEMGLHTSDPTAYKIVGLYPIPTLVCDCKGDKGVKEGGKRIVRGGKLGWWVHKECGKPVKHSYQSPKNLVDADWSTKQDPQVMFRGQIAFKYGMGKLPDAP